MTQNDTVEMLCQVLPVCLTRTIAGLLTDPFVSACLPELGAAMQPLLQHLQPAAADLLSNVALAASQSAQLQQLLQDAKQVGCCNKQTVGHAAAQMYYQMTVRVHRA